MNRKTFSNIFSMVVIAAGVFVFGNYNVKAHIHGDSSIAGKLNLHAENKLVLDKLGKGHVKELRLHENLLLLDKDGLKTDKIAEVKKVDLLKDAKLSIKPDLHLDDGRLLRLEKDIALIKDITVVDHKPDLSPDNKDLGLVDKAGLLSEHPKSGIAFRDALENKLFLDRPAKLGKDELKLSEKSSPALAKKDLLKEEKAALLPLGLDNKIKSGIPRDEKSIVKLHAEEPKNLLDIDKFALKVNKAHIDRLALNVNKADLDDSIAKDIAHTLITDGGEDILVGDIRDKGKHNASLALKDLKIDIARSSHESALPDLGGAESIAALNNGPIPMSAANDFAGLASKKNKVRKELIENIEWQWTNNPISILNAMKLWFTDKNAALQELKKGQAKDQAAQNSYDSAAVQLPDFWSVVLYDSAGDAADFSAIEGYLKWQQQNEWSSLNSSREAWNALPRNEEWAYYNLLWGQRQNWEALRSYRAGWSQNKGQMMSIIDSVWKKQ